MLIRMSNKIHMIHPKGLNDDDYISQEEKD